MADSLDLIAENLTVGNPETIEFGRHTHVQTPVIDVIETRHGVIHLSLVGLIPRLFHLSEIGAVRKVERWRDVHIVEEREVTLDGDGMLHTVIPVPVQLRFHDHVLLSPDLVLEQSGITHRDLLIPPF